MLASKLDIKATEFGILSQTEMGLQQGFKKKKYHVPG